MISSQYFELITYKVFADLRAEASQTYLSFLWWILEPILYMAVFYVVFGLLFKRGGGPEYVPFLLCGLTAWKWFDSSIRAGANSIVANRHLMRQIYLPKIIFPIIAVSQTTLKFFIILSILLIFLQFSGPGVGLSYVGLPAIILVQLVVTIAFASMLAVTVPFLPDIGPLIGNALVLLLFMSGIFFSGSEIPEAYQAYFYMNPMATIVESYRDVLLYASWPNWTRLMWASSLSLIVIALVMLFLKRNDRLYPKILP